MPKHNQPEKAQAGPYSLTGMTEKQLRLIADAVEFYARFLMGQVTTLPPLLQFSDRLDGCREEVIAVLQQFKQLVWPELHRHAHYGIGWNDDKLQQDAQRAYELYKQIRYYFAVRDNLNNIDSSPPLHYSKEPLVEVVEEGGYTYLVYLAINKITGMGYVGCTKNTLDERRRQHKWEANKSRHNTGFYNAIRKYGIENFEFSVLGRYKSEEDMYQSEIFHAGKHPSQYNIKEALGRRSPMKNKEISSKVAKSKTGSRHSEESKKIMSEGRKGILKTREHSDKIAIAKGGRPFWVFRMGENAPFRECINIARTAKELGVNPMVLGKCLRGKQPQSKGYIFKYKE